MAVMTDDVTSETATAPALPPCVLLNRPQLAENIGAVARVMANFGLSDLRLVAPRDGWPQERAWASASGADWVLEGVQVFETLEAAVADLHQVYATTARPRETQLPVITPREAAADAATRTAQGLRCGLLFGAERAGLESDDLALSHAIVTIPVDPRFHSLNLAQAVNLLAYEWRLTVQAAPSAAFSHNIEPPASQALMLGLYEHLEAELDAAGFFFPDAKKSSMVRNLRIALGRSQLTEQEVRTFRGVIRALSAGRGRVLAKMAEGRAREAEARAAQKAAAETPFSDPSGDAPS